MTERTLVVGLGNPEADYGGTRHNVGADTVRILAERHHTSLSRNKRVKCEIGEFTLADHKVVLAIPQSFMNTSGDPIQSAARWYDVAPTDVIVIHDDLDLEVADLRCKLGGGHAGHNGLKDIDRALGTRDYLRVRIGIGRPPGRQPVKDFVLKRFPPAERDQVDVTIREAADCVEVLVTDGIDVAQNRFNTRR